MAMPPSQKDLSELEQSGSSPAKFLATVANFLRCDLRDIERSSIPNINSGGLRKTLAPREEFVLKLLLKRLSDSTVQTGHSPENDQSHSLLIQKSFWVLLLQVLQSIPLRSLAQILSEREFLKSFGTCLVLLLNQEGREIFHLKEHAVSEDAQEQPQKKRKISPLTQTNGTSLEQNNNSANRPGLPGLICRVVSILVQSSISRTGSDEAAASSIRAVLSTSSEDTASMVGKLLRILCRAMIKSGPSPHQQTLFDTLQDVLLIWQYRRSDSNSQASSRNFTLHCLRPALDILNVQDRNTFSDAIHAAAVQELERLVATHSVLPLRALFLMERASSWKGNVSTITWGDIKDLYQVVGDAMLRVDEPTGDELDTDDVSTSMSVTKFFDIAVLAVPRTNLRRTQQEKPWLECLFSVCAYVVSPGLPRMMASREGLLEVDEKVEYISQTDNPDGLNDLLALAARRNLSFSLPVLIYFASAVMASTKADTTWAVIAKIIQQDINVLLPNSGLPNAQHILLQVYQSISVVEIIPTNQYETLRDGVIKPLMKGFARARDINNFVNFWLRGLEESMHRKASGDLDHNSLYGILVWEDVELFTEFEAVVKSLGTPTLARSLMADLLERLRLVGSKVGPTVDVFSRLAVVIALLKGCPEEIQADSQTLEETITATISALNRRSDYQNQRWRLWSFLCECLLVQPPSETIEKHFKEVSVNSALTSLISAKEIMNIPSGYSRFAKLKELLECFNLIVIQAARKVSKYNQKLDSEIESLVELLPVPPKHQSTFCAYQHLDQDPGHLEVLQSDLNLALACVSVLLRNPGVLGNHLVFTTSLLKAMIECLNSCIRASAGPDLAQLLEQTLLVEDVISNSELFNTCCDEIGKLRDENGHLASSARDLLLSLPLHSLKKSQAQSIADLLVKGLLNDPALRPLTEIMADLGLLEMITEDANVSVGKPRNWRDLVELTEVLLLHISVRDLDVMRACLFSLRKIFNHMWRRLTQSEMTGLTKYLLEMYSWSTSRIHELGKVKYTLADSVVLKTFVDGFCVKKKVFSSAISDAKSQELSRDYSEMLVDQLQKLVGCKASKDGVQILECLTKSMTTCEGLDTVEKWVDVQVITEAIIEEWKINSAAWNADGAILMDLLHAQHRLRGLMHGEQYYLRKDIERGLVDIAALQPSEVKEKELRLLAIQVSSFVKSLGVANLSNLLDIVLNGSIDSRAFLLIGAILCEIPPAAATAHLDLVEQLSQVGALEIALKASTSADLCMALECCKSVLDRHHAVVNQSTVDSFLVSITVLVSANAPGEISSEDPCSIFDRLCALVGVALSRFRRRLGGRYHLLLPVLQGLLRCLFYAGTATQVQTKQQLLFARSLPSWLKSSRASLPSSSAEHFTRLLTTICDPSASSVRTSRKHHISAELTDETKKARSLAGQYMQYLIMEYAKCSLNGRIDPNVKERLMPGLYAVMDVMGKEVMRGMNAAMDSSSRVIFKTLYDDYQRHGKWNKG